MIAVRSESAWIVVKLVITVVIADLTYNGYYVSGISYWHIFKGSHEKMPQLYTLVAKILKQATNRVLNIIYNINIFYKI